MKILKIILANRRVRLILIVFSIFFLLDRFAVFSPIKSEIKYHLLSQRAERSLLHNKTINKQNFFKIEEILKNNFNNFSISVKDSLIDISNQNTEKNDIDNYDFYDGKMEGIYYLEDIIESSNHYVFNENRKIRIRYDERTASNPKQAILKHFNNQPNQLLDVLGFLKQVDCEKLIKETNCIRLIHRSFSEWDLYSGGGFCAQSYFNPYYINYTYVIGECKDPNEEYEVGKTIVLNNL